MTAAETHAVTLYGVQVQRERAADLAAELRAVVSVLAMTRQAMMDLAIKVDRLTARERELRARIQEATR